MFRHLVLQICILIGPVSNAAQNSMSQIVEQEPKQPIRALDGSEQPLSGPITAGLTPSRSGISDGELAAWVPGCLTPQALPLFLSFSHLPEKFSFLLPPYHEFSDLSLSCQFCRYHALTVSTPASTISIITTTFRYRKRYPQYLTHVQSCSVRKSRRPSGQQIIHHGQAQ